MDSSIDNNFFPDFQCLYTKPDLHGEALSGNFEKILFISSGCILVLSYLLFALVFARDLLPHEGNLACQGDSKRKRSL